MTHGKSRTRLYKCWSKMKQRCGNPSDTHYSLYGGRGIKVCKEWLAFELFREWAESNGYTDSLTLDRIDVNGNYEPSNCRWVTMKEQANNKRTNHYITYKGVTKSAKEWSEICGISASTLIFRSNHSWPIDKIFEPAKSQKPRKPYKTDSFKEEIISWYQHGITKTEIGKRLNIGRNYIYAALKRWNIINQ